MAKKKVIDILPPRQEKKITERQKGKTLPSEDLSIKKKPLFINPCFKKILIFSLFFLFLLAGFCYFTLSKADIDIWPLARNLTLEENITIKEDVTQIFEEEITLSKLFQSSGRVLKEERAEGIIKVYNEYSTSPQTLVASTRFVSSEGRVFRTPDRVVIPGGRYEQGKFVSGEIDIRVVADEPGPQHNIGPTTFSIPGFAGTTRYTKFYAKSFQVMSGGLQEEVAKILEEDLIGAENVLIKEAEEKCREKLSLTFSREDISSKFYYFPDEIESQLVEKFSLSLAGEEKEEFTFQTKVKCKTISLEKEYLENYIKSLFNAEISENEKILEESLEINYLSREIDLEKKEINFFLEVSAKIYSQIDFYQFQNALVGKSLNESKVLLESRSDIVKADVSLWPFWVRKIPKDLEKVNFSLRFD